MGLTVKQIEHALRGTAGNVTAAANALGITRQGLQARLKKNAALREIVTEEREALCDLAESALRLNVAKGDVASVIFALKTLGKSRGYIERQEVSSADNKPIAVEVAELGGTERAAKMAAVLAEAERRRQEKEMADLAVKNSE